ncbi:hypothetical protein CERSUDRAFT_117848 [Gelatoporia subvermispora B]|uniref:Terpene synthase n=1 Tax=Ceriporiopsis subvermispora (strain B) TaxID=914234 RepID=M2R6F4_CERS8|nr:hypothetical protein CERSUDRAFT_117848 [Gelatoporia subvermispora B]
MLALRRAGLPLLLPRQRMALSIQSLAFVEYRRIKTGVGEAYAGYIWDINRFPDEKAFVQAMPDAVLFIQYVNDIMSFYKEELGGDLGTYVQDRALVTRMTSAEVLSHVVDATIASVNSARAVLGNGPARDAWEFFMRGYIAFHLQAPRYLLHEIMDLEYAAG